MEKRMTGEGGVITLENRDEELTSKQRSLCLGNVSWFKI